MRAHGAKAGGGAQPRRRNSTEQAAAVLAALREAAAASQTQTQTALRAASVPGAGRTRCAYLGQRSSGGTDGHEASPSLWTVPEGSWASRTDVEFRWRLPDGSERIQSAAVHHAQARGLPCEWLDGVLLAHRLQQVAQKAQRSWRRTWEPAAAEAGGPHRREAPSVESSSAGIVPRSDLLTCTYAGRPAGADSDDFVPDASRWPRSGTWPSQEVVTFRWKDASGEQLDVALAANNACKRGLQLPALTPAGTFAEPAAAVDLPARLTAAAHAAQERWSTWGLAAHGRALTCTYIGQDAVAEGERARRAAVCFE